MYSLLLLLMHAATGIHAGAHYPPIPQDRTTPVQQRIAIQSPSQISIAWNTYMKLDKACVKYGTSSNNLALEACSTNPVTYPTSRTWFNTVHLKDLKPATKYHYQIVSKNSTMQHFTSPRLPGDLTPFAFNVVIDMGVYGKDGYTIDKRDPMTSMETSSNHTTIARLLETANQYDFVIHPGDLAYADDWIKHSHNLLDPKDAFEAIQEQFYDQLAPVAGRKPYMISPGNHEAQCLPVPFTWWTCPHGQRNFTDFKSRFGQSMPTAYSSASGNKDAKISANRAQQLAKPPFWYSFEYGMVHIVMIDTETDFNHAPDQKGTVGGLHSGPFGSSNQQLQFLEADLASVDRNITRWVIVAGHRPWYATKHTCESCQKAFEPFMYRYGVDLGAFGHVHNSAIIAPTFRNVKDQVGFEDPKAPMYIVAGGAGNIEGLDKVKHKPDYMDWVNGEDFAFAQVKVWDRKHLTVEFIQSSNGQVIKSAELYKTHSEPFVRQEI